ncbi:hypothetical protein Vadar_034245 [Vaccinium darrowii]|uniref:Uncharacterized protein n=1 Tax=Vaccinium darrowii TaxID=229202 RepID=A0ACB7XEE0_9ERIC|nr:hypothetical protein Vadar_034245 [Vaccinium darrowii]
MARVNRKQLRRREEKEAVVTLTTFIHAAMGMFRLYLFILYTAIYPRPECAQNPDYYQTQVNAVNRLVNVLNATLPQISSRLFVVWGILWSFPEVRTHVLVSSLVISWSITEIIRYSFFGTKEALGFAPSWLLWLRWGNLKLQKSLVVVVRCWLDDAGGCGEMNRHLPNE